MQVHWRLTDLLLAFERAWAWISFSAEVTGGWNCIFYRSKHLRLRFFFNFLMGENWIISILLRSFSGMEIYCSSTEAHLRSYLIHHSFRLDWFFRFFTWFSFSLDYFIIHFRGGNVFHLSLSFIYCIRVLFALSLFILVVELLGEGWEGGVNGGYSRINW